MARIVFAGARVFDGTGAQPYPADVAIEGERIVEGIESGVTPHQCNLRELDLMVAGGMTPAAALEATTRSAAELVGIDTDLGTIEAGKLADLVAVEGDPYAFGDLADRVVAVWKAGEQVVVA